MTLITAESPKEAVEAEGQEGGTEGYRHGRRARRLMTSGLEMDAPTTENRVTAVRVFVC